MVPSSLYSSETSLVTSMASRDFDIFVGQFHMMKVEVAKALDMSNMCCFYGGKSLTLHTSQATNWTTSTTLMGIFVLLDPCELLQTAAQENHILLALLCIDQHMSVTKTSMQGEVSM